jgi:glycosyltransferase involved in cell wall biosynthesis
VRFTLVTTAHVANNPRLVKEADALAAAGHAVHVVALRQRAHLAARDDVLLRGRRWSHATVDADPSSRRGRLRRLTGAALERLLRQAFALGARHPGVADRAFSRHVDALAAACASRPADVVIAHNLQALPAAVRAARRLGARLGFDIEDLHSGELPDVPRHALTRAVISDIERRYLRQCDLLTASSDGIADEIVRLYGVPRPAVILNVFPRGELDDPRAYPGERPAAARVSLYWYSQVIGAGRGLEEAIEAVATLPDDMHLSLRGELDAAFEPQLRGAIARLGLASRVHLLPQALPTELLARAACHDIGLALEQPRTRNRELCVTNKLFTYLLAGLAVVATDTEGQQAVMEAAQGAGLTYPAGDADALGQRLRALADPRSLDRARQRARDVAAARFNWELESRRLVAYLTSAPEAGAITANGLACATS